MFQIMSETIWNNSFSDLTETLYLFPDGSSMILGMLKG